LISNQEGLNGEVEQQWVADRDWEDDTVLVALRHLASIDASLSSTLYSSSSMHPSSSLLQLSFSFFPQFSLL